MWGKKYEGGPVEARKKFRSSDLKIGSGKNALAAVPWRSARAEADHPDEIDPPLLREAVASLRLPSAIREYYLAARLTTALEHEMN